MFLHLSPYVLTTFQHKVLPLREVHALIFRWHCRLLNLNGKDYFQLITGAGYVWASAARTRSLRSFLHFSERKGRPTLSYRSSSECSRGLRWEAACQYMIVQYWEEECSKNNLSTAQKAASYSQDSVSLSTNIICGSFNIKPSYGGDTVLHFIVIYIFVSGEKHDFLFHFHYALIQD